MWICKLQVPVSFPDPVVLEEAVTALSAVDPVIARLADRHGIPVLDRRSLRDFALEEAILQEASEDERLFSELVEVVVHQQLAGRAAIAIGTRIKAALGGRTTPERVLACDPELLRATGLSQAKLTAIIGLARAVHEGELLLGSLAGLSDEAVTLELSKLRGFGPWSAQMFLMFSLGRIDVWPAGDLGVRKGYGISYGLGKTPSPAELSLFGERFRPYRSLVAWYMWRSLSE